MNTTLRPFQGRSFANDSTFERSAVSERSSEAFTSRKSSANQSPRRSRANAIAVEVFPVPGGPWNRRFGGSRAAT
jgi:hypothetical protein